jgi:hypothetical protein
MPQTTRWRFDEFTVGHYTTRRRRVKWFERMAAGKLKSRNTQNMRIRPGGTMENLRWIPPSFQDDYIFGDETRHDVPG